MESKFAGDLPSFSPHAKRTSIIPGDLVPPLGRFSVRSYLRVPVISPRSPAPISFLIVTFMVT